MKNKNLTRALGLLTLSTTFLSGCSELPVGTSVKQIKEYIPEESTLSEDNAFNGVSKVGGEIGRGNPAIKRANEISDADDMALTKPTIGYQMAYKNSSGTYVTSSSSDIQTVSIRYIAAINSLDVDSAIWTKAMYDEKGNAYENLKISEKTSTVAYTALNSNGTEYKATDVANDIGEKPYNYFVVYTLKNIPYTDYQNYFLDASLTLTKGDKSVTSTVKATQVKSETAGDDNNFMYERGSVSALDFDEEISGDSTTLLAKSKSGSTESSIDIPSYADNGNGRYAVDGVAGSGFEDVSSITTLTLPEGMTKIGNFAFAGCSFSALEIPSSITEIGKYAFSSCDKLIEVKIPSSVKSIGEYTFTNCESLTKADLFDMSVGISNYMFRGCAELSDVEIGSGVSSIGAQSFSGCYALKRLRIPATVNQIGWCAFSSCRGLVVFVEDETKKSEWDDGNFGGEYVSYIYGNKTGEVLTDSETGFTYAISTVGGAEKVALVEYVGDSTSVSVPATIGGKPVCSVGFAFYGKSVESVALPESITEVSPYAFGYCLSLRSVSLPKGTTKIGDYAFWDCPSLEEFNFPSSLESIGSCAFYNCNSLKEAVLPNGLKSVGSQAFEHCEVMKSIYIPSSVDYIGRDCFRYCTKLSIYCEKFKDDGDVDDTNWDSSWNADGRPVKKWVR